MAITGLKHMSTAGSVNYAGTSATVLDMTDATLQSDGVTVHWPNWGGEDDWEAGDALNIYDQEEDGTVTEGIYEITGVTSDDLTITPSAGSARTEINVAVGGPWPPKHPAWATGSSHISHSFGLAVNWTLVAIRCHFTGGSGSADFVVALDAELGAAYDTTLYTVPSVGTDTNDVHFRLGTSETGDPSAWQYRADDQLTFAWTNPNTQTWGLVVIMIPTNLLEAY
jgi:hypothetical protein